MLYNELKQVKLIPVLRKIPYETSKHLINALISGGIEALEITMDSDRACEIIRETTLHFGGNVLVGAGTVLTVEDCKQAIEAGAQFIVSPSLNIEVIQYSLQKGIAVIPGVFTPTEMQTAYMAGAQMIKLFPASALSPSFIKDVKGPLSHISIMTTGGITRSNAKDYILAGATIVGAGSDLLNKQHIQNAKWDEIKSEAERWIASLT